jgi:hypothetical protein
VAPFIHANVLKTSLPILPSVKELLARYSPPDDDNEAVYAWLQRRFLADNRTPSSILPLVKDLLARYGLPDDDNEAVCAWLRRRFLADTRTPSSTSTEPRLPTMGDNDGHSDTSLESLTAILENDSSKRKLRPEVISLEGYLPVPSKRSSNSNPEST